MQSFAEQVIRFRWPILIGFVLVTLALGVQMRHVQIDTDLKNHLPDSIQSRMDTEKMDALFGGTEMLMVLIKTDDVLNTETLGRIREIARDVNRLKGVDKVLSLFDLKSIKGEDGAMIVDPAVKRIPKTDTQREILREELKVNDIVYGSVVSEDFTVTAVIAMLKEGVSDEAMVEKVQAVVNAHPGPEMTLIGGLPFVRKQMGAYIRRDLRVLLPIGIGIMLIFLFACFRMMRGVILPFAVVLMSILFSMGLIPLFGWKIQMVTNILPILLIAVANDYGIHMIAKYQEDNIPSNNFTRKELAGRMFQSLGKPVLLTGLTTMAGMLCLMGHVMVPAKELGILAAVGIVYALAASLFFIPAVISLLPLSKPAPAQCETDYRKKPALERLLHFFGDLVSLHPKKVIVASLMLSLLCGVGIFRVVVDTNPASYYQKDDPVVIASDLIDAHLGGSQNIAVVYRGDIKDPVLLKKINAMEHALDEMDEVGVTTSVARVVRQMSRALNDPGDPMYDRIPMERNAVAQYFELYAMSGDPDDFEKMVDFPYEHALVTARINKTSTVTLSKVVRRIQNMTQNDPDVMLTGGFGVVLSDLAKAVVNGQLISLFMAACLVAILLMILFRSVAAGLISVIPLALSMIILFGLMGVFSIELNIATAMLSSIMIGVGIDYTIHFLWRYREERNNGLAYTDAVRKTLATTGRGIIFNALSVVVGFSVLMISSFMPVRFFGFLVIVSIIACLIGALMLIPALCLVMRPKFLEPIAVSRSQKDWGVV